MNKNLVIAVASKGRANTSTVLRRLQNISGIDIFVYVDSHEKSVYEEYYPNFIIVEHDYKTIVQIRAFVQEHQYGLGNTYLSIDDDIAKFVYCKKENTNEWFDASLTDVINDTKELLEQGHDFIFSLQKDDKDFYIPLKIDPELSNEHTEYWNPIALAVMCLTPRLYDIGIRFSNTTNPSEDIYITIETFLAQERGDIKIGIMSYCFIFDYTSISNFKPELYYESIFAAYIEYGYVFDVIMDSTWLRVPYAHINKEAIKAYIEHGVIYTPYFDTVCKKTIEKKTWGYKILEKNNWKPAVNYKKKLLKKISKRKLFYEIHKPSIYGENANPIPYLIYLEMLGKVYTGNIENINEETFPNMRLYQNEHGELVNENENILQLDWDNKDEL